MGHGGRRPGAGAKPRIGRKQQKTVVLDITNGQRIEAVSTIVVSGDDPLLQPPTDLGLSDAAMDAWRRFAPYALAERTLIASRTPGFAKLCEEWAFCAAFEKRIREIGVAASESNHLVKQWNDCKKQLKSSFADFNLKSFGKPATVDKTKPAANPFSKLA